MYGKTLMVNAAVTLLTPLLLLHGVTGREIRINPRNVTSLHASVPQGNKTLAAEVKCLINTSDGKFVSVIETCEIVSQLIAGAAK